MTLLNSGWMEWWLVGGRMDGWNDADLWAGRPCSDLRVSVGVEDSANVSPDWNTMQLILSIVMTRVLYIVLVDILTFWLFTFGVHSFMYLLWSW